MKFLFLILVFLLCMSCDNTEVSQEKKESPFTFFLVDKDNHMKNSTDSRYTKIFVDSQQYYFVEIASITKPDVTLRGQEMLEIRFDPKYNLYNFMSKYRSKNLILLFDGEIIKEMNVMTPISGDFSVAMRLSKNIYESVKKRYKKKE